MLIGVVLSPEWAETVRFGLAILIPLAVGLITKSSASSGLKSTLNVVLSALVTGITTILDDADASVANVTREFILTAVASFASYYGVWKPNGLAGTIAARTPDFGLGSPPAPTLTTEEKGLEDVVVAPEVMDEIVEQVDNGVDATDAVVDVAVPDGTVDEVIAWVGDDAVRAAAALAVEQAGKNRKGVITALESVLGEP